MIEKSMIMFIRISTKCNAGCFMCKYANNIESYNITREQIEYIIKYMKENGNYKMIRFTGGEPLLHPDISYFIKKCKDEGYKTSIISNGYLIKEKYKELLNAGIDQVIFSLDGSTPKIHDKIRNLNGLFNNVIEGMRILKEKNKNIILRVNTVVSKYNIDDLMNILNLLIKNDIDMWSIIPLKSSKVLWSDENKEEEYIEKYKKFKMEVMNINRPKFLGYSKEWGGRTEEEIHNMFYDNKLYRPLTKCGTAERISFYIPDKNEVIPCNCASHRTEQIKVKKSEKSINNNTDNMRKWLNENGNRVCTGCEPLNVYLAENPNIIDNDIFSF